MDAFRYDGKRVLVVGGASGNGVTVLVDAGHVRSGLTGSFDAPIIKMILGVE